MSEDKSMTIWVDADACPRPVREIICRAAIRCSVPAVFVANHYLALPSSPYLRCYQVAGGFDVADNEIVERAAPGDMVVSGDIPLAAELLTRHNSITVLDSRGEVFTPANIRQRLAMRNLMESMRNDYGLQSGGQSAYSQADSKAFADQLDRYLAQSKRL